MAFSDIAMSFNQASSGGMRFAPERILRCSSGQPRRLYYTNFAGAKPAWRFRIGANWNARSYAAETRNRIRRILSHRLGRSEARLGVANLSCRGTRQPGSHAGSSGDLGRRIGTPVRWRSHRGGPRAIPRQSFFGSEREFDKRAISCGLPEGNEFGPGGSHALSF